MLFLMKPLEVQNEIVTSIKRKQSEASKTTASVSNVLTFPKSSYISPGFTVALIAIKICGFNGSLSTYNFSRWASSR